MELQVYEKRIKYIKDGKEKFYPQAKTKYRNKFFNVTIAETAKELMIKKSLKLPLEFTLSEETQDYFITKKKTVNEKDGKTYTNYTIVITDFRDAKPFDFESVTLDDVVDGLAKEE